MVLEKYLPFGKPAIDDDEIAAVTRVMRSGWIGMGQETQLFEEELAVYFSQGAAIKPNIITVSSCTDALFLSLKLEDVGVGDEVIVPSLTWCSTANVVLYAGAKVVFCDVDEHTYSISIDTILSKITSRTKAVILVHYGGLAIDVKSIREALPDHIKIIEDAAHALGAKYPDGRYVGMSENLTCFSFYANKNLSTAEGGAIAVWDQVKAEKLRELRLHGLKSDAWKRYADAKTIFSSPNISELGYKANYTDLQAAIGRVQLKKQPDFSQRRLDIATFYCENLPKLHPLISWQDDILSPSHARHLFVICFPKELKRDEILVNFRDRNVGATIHYPLLHEMPLFKVSSNVLPVCEDIGTRILTLPISASMTIDDADNVIQALRDILKV